MATNSFNSYTDITNAYNVSGSGFSLGVRSGAAQLPGRLNPGVPLGMTHSYSVVNPVQTNTLLTVSGTGAANQYLPLRNIPANMGRYTPDMNVGIQLDYPRQVSFTCTATCTVIFNITDRYGNKAVNVISGFSGNTNIGVCTLNSIQFITAAAGAWAITVTTTNFLELPFTDMGNQIFFEWLGVASNNNPQVAFTTTTGSITPPLKYKMDMAYIPASWSTPLTPFKITTTTGSPRPFFKPQEAGTDVNYSTNPYAIMVQQAVFPTYNPQLSWLMSPQQAESGETTMGLLPDSTGWVGWKG